MKTIAIKMKSFTEDWVLLRSLLASLALLVFCYLFFIGAMVWNIVERKTLEAEARTLTNEVRDLELLYFAKAGKIDLELSQNLGFKEIKATFVTRRPVGGLNSKHNESQLSF